MIPDRMFIVEINTKDKEDKFQKITSEHCTMKELIALINRNYNKIVYINARVRK